MKKVLLFIFCIFSFGILNAETFKVPNTDMTIELDTDKWFVETRDTYEETINDEEYSEEIRTIIKDIFTSEKTVNIYAITQDDNNNPYDFFVSTIPFEDFSNLSTLNDEELDEVIEDFTEMFESQFSMKKVDVYKDGKYTYMYVIYNGNQMEIHYYITVVNNKMYRIYLRYNENNTNPVFDIRKDILSNIEYDVKSVPFEDIKYKSTRTLLKILEGDIKTIAIVFVPIIAIIVLIVVIVKKNNKKQYKKLTGENKEFWS